MDTNVPKSLKIYDLTEEDVTKFIPPETGQTDQTSYIQEISIDPDKQMPATWRKRFNDLCVKYSTIISPRPGKYNGAFGRVSTDIHFSTFCFLIPFASNLKTYLPKYSFDMLQTLGEKMDTLETWGLLRKPNL